MNPVPASRRTQVTYAAVMAWLLLLTVAVAVFGGDFVRLQQQLHSSAFNSITDELNTRIAALENLASAANRQPAALSLTEFRPLRKQWNQRLTQLEQDQQTTAKDSDLETLRARMDALEQSQKAAAVQIQPTTRKAQRPSMVKRRTAPTVPDFTPLGIELRGGERFLAIAPNGGATALNQVQLLAVGEAQGRWQLQAMQSSSSLFRVEQQIRRLNVPQE